MKFTKFTKSCMAFRKQKRDLLKDGWIFVDEINWEIHRGTKHGYKVTDLKLGVNGNSFYYKMEKMK